MMEGKRILIVDDEEVISFGFSMVLKEPGIEVDCAQTIEDAANFINARTYAAAIVDLRLSDSTEMEGFDCIRFLHSCQNGCKIIVLTAYSDNDLRERAKALGADLFYEKPTEPEIIRNALSQFAIYQQ
jgi:DNA-binding response OmpR family regulator